MLSPESRRIRAKLASTTRHHPDTDVTALRTELKAVKAEEYIRQLVDSAPPLSESTRARLAALLAPSVKSEAA